MINMTAEQIEKYRNHLQRLIERKYNDLTNPAYADKKDFLRGKLQAYIVALDSLDMFIEYYGKR